MKMLVVSSKVSSESDEKTSKLREVGHVVVEQKQLEEVEMHLEEHSCTGLGTNLMNTDLVLISC